MECSVFFVKMKSQFPGLSESKQEANADCHIASGCWFICWKKQKCKGERHRRSDRHREVGRDCGHLEQLVFSFFLFFFLRHNEVGTESLCIGLINSYSSSAWHPGTGWVCPWANLQACGRQPIHQSPVQTAYCKLSGPPKEAKGCKRK